MTEKRKMSGPEIAGALVLLPVHAVASGLMVRYLYDRLLRPSFHALPPLSVAGALGLAIVVGYLTSDELDRPSEFTESLYEREVRWIATRLMTLALAFVVGFFV